VIFKKKMNKKSGEGFGGKLYAFGRGEIF